MTGVTKAIRRALDVVSGHPLVREIRTLDEHGSKVAVDFVVPMPSRWIGAGQSPAGVRPVETVTFTFDDSFPLAVPLIELRQDFNRSHPHVQPGRTEDPPRPCYFEGDPQDLLRYRGMDGIMVQVADWLEKAAAAALMDFSQGWEPVRRDLINDWVEVDPNFVRGFVNRDGGSAFAVSQHLGLELRSGGHAYAISVEAQRQSLGPDVFRKVIENAAGVGLSVIVWGGKTPSGDPVVSDRYLPETVRTMAELTDRAAHYGLQGQLRAAFGLLQTRFGKSAYKLPLILTLLLVVRRPAHVIGQGSPLEIVPYVIEVRSASDFSGSSEVPVRPAAVRDAISRKLLASVSGSRPLEEAQWTLIGCGSVGAKLAIHLAREGRAPTTLVDRSLMAPHNYARHGLVPIPQFPVPDWKADAVARAIQGLGQSATPLHEDLAVALASSPPPKQIWPKATQLLVDATGSPTVTDALCLPQVEAKRPRVVETSLLGRGSVSYMAIEGPKANPSVQDLQAESYRLMADDDTLRELALASASDVVVVGQGCSTRTAQMTDARLSSFVPGMARYLSTALERGLPVQDGELAIGRVDDDLMNQSWQRFPVPAFRRLRSSTGRRASISHRVVELIDSAIADRPHVETGGILIGRFNEATDSFHIVDIVEPPPDSRFSAAEFTLGVEGIRDRLKAYNDRTRGTLYPVGTWHNHLANTPASLTDLATAAALALGQRFPVVLMIRTPGSIRGVIADSDRSGATPAVTIESLEETLP
ncbi:Mov34/MPN/PAD-1 family protein [Aminobacter carboxidus]|uniref:Mov34/MPN/PAD-1 family protein n=1 Tax=Aminobacter carboxidus TaxID=376165 RepID=A0ABR9GVI0_9HYPH|nr:Mov34/MPN/PAD-1 family protein [Aminobacter carboxidus]MBE1207529.1 Mov34/MPN/PAD-1 family protein [Aminobacter carboxidus]